LFDDEALLVSGSCLNDLVLTRQISSPALAVYARFFALKNLATNGPYDATVDPADGRPIGQDERSVRQPFSPSAELCATAWSVGCSLFPARQARVQ
jgi:hypothetical protein